MGILSRPGPTLVPHPRRGVQQRAERLAAPRLTFVRGVNAVGKAFERDAVLKNISTSGLYPVLPEAVDVGTTLFLVVRFAFRDAVPVPRVALRGRVVRIEPPPSGRHGVGVAFARHRFL